MSSYTNLVRWAKSKGVRFIRKRDSLLMRVISALLYLVPGISPTIFMDRFTSQIGSTVYWANRYLSTQQKARILSHEMMHHHDSQRMGFLKFGFIYAFPQILALPAIPALIILPIWYGSSFLREVEFNHTWWLWLLWLVFAAPWPSPGRTWAELRGYTVTLWTYKKQGLPVRYDRIIKNFTGGSYYWMSWSTKNMEKKLEESRRRVLDGTIANHIPYINELNDAWEGKTDAE